MSSPVIFPYKKLISIDPEEDAPVYLQIAQRMSHLIRNGHLPANHKLPGTRTLSELLGVHRKTVVAAFNELEMQGWIIVLPNKGCFIKNKRAEAVTGQLVSFPAVTGFSIATNTLLESTPDPVSSRISFDDGQPDIRLAYAEQLAARYSAALSRKINRRLWGYQPGGENIFFKNQLTNFLNSTRGLRAAPKNIVSTRGTEMNLYLAAQTLLSANDWVIVGNPSYHKANMVFQQAGAILKPVPVDHNGIDVDAIKRICKRQSVKMVYITPHYHYPTTVSLSTERRLQLLELSYRFGFIILEDDYDYDFSFNSNAELPLGSIDNKGMVVSVGSFCKTLAPGFRTGFIVAPENLVKEINKLKAVVDANGDLMMEQVLGEMIAEGEILRHLKKTHQIYRDRRDHFCNHLNKILHSTIDFKLPQGGLAVWLPFRTRLNLSAVAKTCRAGGLHLPATLLFQTRDLTAIRLGFAAFNEAESIAALQTLHNAITAQRI
ncbi:PLP-dependent aminotransferase family protein [Niabella yanshanensis]|uniref:PLP-dependent aminotransferase family protein n=1 Tax=Niabella yanshanensis TaxID=577386 RepID=A0ABZ0W1D2_9BACT|nr:PLP-dependent aminotransferase family protein [Niabella yanshanensis]WQD36886.1 PLP-dependent aminotransferase family protein [Niabella yanshanensis]